jgi:hypothetical protein
VRADFDFNPTLTGELTSNMCIVDELLTLTARLTENMMIADDIGSNPPLILAFEYQVDKAASADNSKEVGVFSASLDTCANKQDYYYQVDMERRADDLEAWQAGHGGDMNAADEFGPSAARALANRRRAHERARAPDGAVDYAGREMPWARTHRLRSTDKPFTHQLPRTRADYLQIIEQLQESICRVIGVPPALMQAAASVRAGVEALAEDMHATVRHHADVLSALLTGIYRHIFLESDLRDELRSRAESRRRRPDERVDTLLKETDLFEAREATRVTIGFDLPPAASIETLAYARDRGILSWETFNRAVLRTMNLPSDNLESTTDPYSLAERKLAVIGRAAQAPASSSSSSASSSAAKKSPSSSSSSSPSSSSSSSSSTDSHDDAHKRKHAAAAASGGSDNATAGAHTVTSTTQQRTSKSTSHVEATENEEPTKRKRVR